MTRSLCLLRHGEADGGARFRGSLDDPLTETGWQQMRDAVAAGSWDEVVSSPLDRCRAFATQLAGELDLPFRLDPRLREYHFGAWEGRSFAELSARDALAVAAFFKDPFDHPPPESEPMESFVHRVGEAFLELSSGECQRTLVVTHGGVIRVLLCQLRQWPWSRMAGLEVGHASLHRFSRAADGRWEENP